MLDPWGTVDVILMRASKRTRVAVEECWLEYLHLIIWRVVNTPLRNGTGIRTNLLNMYE